MTCCPTCGSPLPPSRIIVDLASNTIVGPKGSMRLSPSEARLLEILNRRRGGVDRDAIIHAIWPRDEPEDAIGVMKAHICHLRLGRQSRGPISSIGLNIETIWGLGYRLVETTEVRP